VFVNMSCEIFLLNSLPEIPSMLFNHVYHCKWVIKLVSDKKQLLSGHHYMTNHQSTSV
jgi:hypothetical protein